MKNFWKTLNTLEPRSSIEKDILRVIKTNPFSILDMTIDEFALRCYTTKSTVVKTLQKAGLTGYKELKSVIYNDGLVTKEEMDSISTEGQAALNNIRASDLLLQESGILNIERYITLKSKVCIVASEITSNIAKDFRKDLNTLGIRTTVVGTDDPDFFVEDYDCVIFISASGVNSGVYNRCKSIIDSPAKKKPKIISLTSTNTSNIKEMSDLYLPGSRYISITEKEYYISTQTILVLWFTMVRIVEELYSKNSKAVEERLKLLKQNH